MRRQPAVPALLGVLGLLAACQSDAPPVGDGARPPTAVSLDGQWFLEGLPPEVDASASDYTPQDPVAARVPGIVQEALFAAGRIPDPYLGTLNEQSQWVPTKAWWYRRTFDAPAAFRGRTCLLRFEGVVYESTVWMNGRKVGQTEGMHDRAAFDVTSALRHDGPNLLVVRIPPPPDDRAKGEVCQMSYGWDFAPKLVPAGIWRPVTLEAVPPQWIESPSVETTEILEDGTARLTLRATLANSTGSSLQATLSGAVAETGARFEEQVELAANAVREVAVNFRLPEARLWWPHTMGGRHLYRLELSLDPPGAAASTRFGVRTVRLEKNPGAAEKDLPWTFVINGRRNFITGVNWVPVDSLYRLDRWRYEALLRRARDSGAELIRAWGGGILETEEFYDLCDELGLLVWQEFPLSVSEDYSKIPRKVFWDNAADQIRRLRGRPSLVLWNGGNEFNPDAPKQKDLIDGLAAAVGRLDPSRPFYRASPYHGEEHDWTVWHGLQPYTEYRRAVGFRSEAGLQSPPSRESLRRFLPADELWPLRPVHEYHRLMSQTERYTNEYGTPDGLDDWVRKLQLAHAIALQFNVETCRAKKYATSGVLPWQWNEPWPCICWSLVDWYGVPKPAAYYCKRAFEPVRITADFEKYKWAAGETWGADVIVVNDRGEALEGLKASAELVDRAGRVLASRTFVCAAGADDVARAGRIEWTPPADGDDVPGRLFFLRLGLKDAGGVELSRNVYWHGIERPRPVGWLQKDIIFGWRMRIDPQDAGVKEGWCKPEYDDASWGPYQAGVPWELQGHQGYDGNGWLRIWTEIPESWKGGPVLAGFGGVDDAYTLYVNGEKAAKHGEYPNNVWNKLTTTDIAKLVKFGEKNLIVMHVEDWRVDGAIHKLPSRLANNPAAFTVPEYDDLFAGLARLDRAEVRAGAARAPKGGVTRRLAVRLENASAVPAFQVELEPVGIPDGWLATLSDSAFVLWGGEAREVVLEVTPLESWPGPRAEPGELAVRVKGWNVEERVVGP